MFEKIGSRWLEGITDWIDLSVQVFLSGYRRRYLEYITFQNRILDVKALTTQGAYNLDLNTVFVELSVEPALSNEKHVLVNPFSSSAQNLDTGQHSIWEYINSSWTNKNPSKIYDIFRHP